MRERWCEWCDRPQKARQQGEHLYCIACGSRVGFSDSSIDIQFL